MDRFAKATELYERKRRSAAETVVIEKRSSLDPTPRIPSDEQDFKTFLAALVPMEKEMKKQTCLLVRDLSDAERHAECRTMCKW